MVFSTLLVGKHRVIAKVIHFRLCFVVVVAAADEEENRSTLEEKAVLHC